MPMSQVKVLALTSDLAYPAILSPEHGEVVNYRYVLWEGYCTYQ